MTSTWTAPALVKWIAEDLAAKGFPPPHRPEAERLVSFALGLSRLELYLQFDKPINEREREHLKALLRRRYLHEPLGYVLGEAHFWGLTLAVGPGVLTPRFDSEILIEACLPCLPKEPGKAFQAVELGAGSLCLSLAIGMEGKGMELLALEASPEALSWAKKNLARYQGELQERGNHLRVLLSDGFAALEGSQVDLIFSNPPYIARREVTSLEPEVRDFEPLLALDGGESGLEFYHLLAQTASQRLKIQGWLCFEHGFDQQDAILDLLKGYPALKLDLLCKDYQGHPRAMRWQKIA